MSTAETLVQLSQERDAPAIVLGSHGHRALREVIVGSTSHGVLRHAPCPVVIGPPPEDGRH